jgi:arabinogalactan oligomer/maltooligosaccharide transport system permease protein
VRRALILLALLVLALVAAPGCGEPPRGVVVWHPYRGGEQKALESIALRFEKEHGTKVTLLSVPYEAYLSKLEAAIPRGNGPDVFLGPHNRLGEYLLHVLVAPAGDAIPDADVALYDQTAVQAITHDGKRWAVPLASKCAALYVDTDLLPEPPKTLGDIERAKASLPNGVWPLVYESQSVYYHAAILHAYGGKFFEDDRFLMIGPEAERSLEKVRELTAGGIVPPEPSGDLVKQLFSQKKAATAIGGPWLAADLPADLHYTVVALPAIEGAGRMRPYLTVDAAFLTPEGARSDDARTFARFLASDASAAERAETGKQVVTTRSFWERPPSAGTETLRAFRLASADAIPMPVSMAMNPAWDPALQAMRKVLRGTAPPGAALSEAKARYDDVMRPTPRTSSTAPMIALSSVCMLLVAIWITRRATRPGFRRELRESVPVYKYLAHAVLTIVVLVVLPLVAGALTSFYAGTREDAHFVGLANYVDILTARGRPLEQWLTSGSFYFTLLVTVAWTLVNVFLHVSIGLVLGIALARPFLKLRAVYRVLLILPWAVPSYVTALAWKGMFHQQYGAINALLGTQKSWFATFSGAFTANVSTNVWLGFPFMMVVVMGALTSIPKDVLEAAEVDGATRWQSFWLVTLPLLRPTLLPAVILGSVWTFNMFNVIFLVSGGEPDGTTDILVSEAYRWAFARNAQFGYAAAYAVIIFGLLVVMSRVLGGKGERA